MLLGGCESNSPMKSPEQETYSFRDRAAWRLENDRLRVTVLQGGGHIAEVVAKTAAGESVNPLWVPPWPSIDPWTYDRGKHGAIYGTDSEAALLSGIMGHNLCFDYWGAPSKTEFKAGLAYHGEVSILPAQFVSQDDTSLVHRFDLVQSGTSITRTMRLAPGQPILYVEETVRNKLSLDRPFGWVQHVTFGPPFVDPDETFFDASATRGDTWDEESDTIKPLGDWPVGGDDRREDDYRRFAPKAPSLKMAYFLLDPERDIAFISAVNTKYHLMMLYVFRRSDYPWMMVWEENRRLQTPPWNGETMTRGMEFGNTRIAGTAREYAKQTTIHDTPAFGWLDGKGEQTARYLAILTEVPEGFRGVTDVRIDGAEIVVQGFEEGESIRVAFEKRLFPLD